MYGEGAPTYQGSASFELPPERRFQFEITDSDELERAVRVELKSLGADESPPSGDARSLLETMISATRRDFGESQLIELGVGCEACHGGAKEHVQNPKRRPSFALKSSFVASKAPGGTDPTRAQDINRTCARCHTVLFTRYPHTWEGRARSSNPGGSHINSGEARDLLLGGCSTELNCANCHDPHGKGKSMPVMDFDALCATCHPGQGAPERRAMHTHHPAGSPGSRCINCHMPRKNMGLAYDLVRYHRIGSPTDRERVEGDRPLECALCHADRSVQSLVSTMERWWNKSYNPGALRELYGPDLGTNAIDASLHRGKPHEKAVAIGVIKEQNLVARAPLLVEELDNEYPLVRFFAKSALERLLGPPPPIDWHAPGPVLVEHGRRWLGQSE
jgi:predicted CXXCH cytochrome family protein